MGKVLLVQEVTKILRISRVTVLNKIKRGEISAQKAGKAYVIDSDQLTIVEIRDVSVGQKKIIEEAVSRVILEYGEALRLLKDA